MKRHRSITADLFAGLGGLTKAAESVGLRVAIAANHNPIAVRAHSANHPKVRHVMQDLQQADFYDWPRLGVLLGSPACQGNSTAATGGRHGRGKRRGSSPKHDRDRSTAWAIVTCAEVHRPPIVVVENVKEMMTTWILFQAWVAALEALGYHVQLILVDAADCGVPQERERLFIVATLKPLSKIEIPKKPMVPAASIIDLSRGEWQRVKWAAEGVQQRCALARERNFPTGPFITQNTTDHAGRSLDRPLGTVTTVSGHWGVVKPSPRGDLYRLLTIDELRAACGFPQGTWLPRTKTHATRLLGNAVPPPMGEAVLREVLAAA